MSALYKIGYSYDFVFMEGFQNIYGKDNRIYKVLVIKNKEELKEYINLIDTRSLVAIFLNGLEVRDIDETLNHINARTYKLDLRDIQRFKYFLVRELKDNFYL